MKLNLKDYRDKVLGCWMGKNIGGTLGAPMEWRRQVNAVSFYTQDLKGDPLPNDDLDIQLLWLVALEEKGIDLDARLLAEYWCLYVTPHWSEYGTAKINLRSGLPPPLSGTSENLFKDSCGAFIRSEIWACVCPGNPQQAARYAYEDAILDHGNGEGTYAEVFCAALEAAAFVETDLRKLIDIGLSFIPPDCGVAKAVRCARQCQGEGKTWQEARDEVLRLYRGSTFFHIPACISDEDRKKGFDQGQLGWDVPSNLGMLVIGLLYGEGDFAQSVCIAVNCGEDTDCTGATVGSIFGILHGITAIPEKWITPIGRKIKTACLNLGELGYFGNQLPQDVDDMTRRTERIARQVTLRYSPQIELVEDGATDLTGFDPARLFATSEPRYLDELYFCLNGPVYTFDFFRVAVDYGPDGAAVRNGEAKTVKLKVWNRYKVQTELHVKWYAAGGWEIGPQATGRTLNLGFHLGRGINELTFTLKAAAVPAAVNRLVVELTSPGRPLVMLVPVVLRDGNLADTPPA